MQAYPVSLSLARRLSSLQARPHTPALARTHAASESDTPPGQRDKDFHLDLPDEENIKKNLVGDLAAHQRETEAEQEAAEEGVGATAVPAGEKDEDATAEVAGNAAIYCNPFDTEEIAEGMRQLLTNKSLREELSQVGLKRAELFSWDASAEKVWTILENTIAGK